MQVSTGNLGRVSSSEVAGVGFLRVDQGSAAAADQAPREATVYRHNLEGGRDAQMVLQSIEGHMERAKARRRVEASVLVADPPFTSSQTFRPASMYEKSGV